MQKIIVLGTGGTIAGTAASSSDHTGYTAAQLSVANLLLSVAGMQEALQGDELHSEQVAQLDSKDMDFATMTRLAQRCAHHLAQSDVRGIVITHGTDTLEETAYFLHLVVGAACPDVISQKPVVLTCAMRPATSSEADGPRNLSDAVVVARDALHNGGRSRGVLAVCAGDVHHAVHVQKIHTYALNAFSSGDVALGGQSALAQINPVKQTNQIKPTQQALVHWNASAEAVFKQNMPQVQVEYSQLAHYLIASREPDKICWPRVEIVMNHAHQSGSIVRALLAASTHEDLLRGIVVAGTGNGTVSEGLQSALNHAAQLGIKTWLATRCTWDASSSAVAQKHRHPAKARIELMLSLLLA